MVPANVSYSTALVPSSGPAAICKHGHDAVPPLQEAGLFLGLTPGGLRLVALAPMLSEHFPATAELAEAGLAAGRTGAHVEDQNRRPMDSQHRLRDARCSWTIRRS